MIDRETSWLISLFGIYYRKENKEAETMLNRFNYFKWDDCPVYAVQGPRRSGKTTWMRKFISGYVCRDYLLAQKNSNPVSFGFAHKIQKVAQEYCRYVSSISPPRFNATALNPSPLKLRGRYFDFILIDDFDLLSRDAFGEYAVCLRANRTKLFVTVTSLSSLTEIPKRLSWAKRGFDRPDNQLSVTEKEILRKNVFRSELTDRKEILSYFYPGYIQDKEDWEEDESIIKPYSHEDKKQIEPICENCKHYKFLELKCKINPDKFNLSGKNTCDDFDSSAIIK